MASGFIKNLCEIIDILKGRDFNATSLPTYNVSTLCTTLPHNVIKMNLLILLKEPSREKALLTLHVMTEMHFLLQKNLKKYHAWSCQNACDALTFFLDNIFIRFGTKLYRQVVGIPMGTNCAPLIADLFLFCYESDFIMSLSDDKQADVILMRLTLHPDIWTIF